ncbi:MAG: hypothetical protein ABI693_28200 [Bryobacteraceae bacterium]
MLQTKTRGYKVYVLTASVPKLEGKEKWNTEVFIRHRDKSSADNMRCFSGSTWPTAEQALKASIQLGQAMIDTADAAKPRSATGGA